MRILVTGTVTGQLPSRVLSVLAALGPRVETANVVELKPVGITGGWLGEQACRVPSPQYAYGPQAKGRGGKVKRW